MAVLVGQIWRGGEIPNFIFFNLTHISRDKARKSRGEKGTSSLAKIRKGESDEM